MDIGANTGLFSIAGCALNSRLKVIAVEALPNQSAGLRKNIILNDFGSRIRVQEVALADHEGIVDFHEAEDNTMGSLDTKGYQGQAGTVISVACTTIDRLLEKEQFRPDLVKIDVEGFEDTVLSNGLSMLENYRPRMVIEVNPGKDCSILRHLFKKYSYSVLNITDAGLIAYDEVFPSQTGNNWLCIPN